MSSALDVVWKIVDGLLSLTFIACAFLLWTRSKAAAILGAAAGAAQLFVLFVFVAMEIAGAASMAMRLVNVVLSGFGNLVFYGCMIAMVFALAKANEAAR